MPVKLNRYYGQIDHADTCQLRRKIYQEMLGPIKRYILPTDASATASYASNKSGYSYPHERAWL